MFNGTSPAIDAGRICLIDVHDLETVEEESKLRKLEAAFKLQLSSQEMSTRLRTELVNEEVTRRDVLPRDHPVTAERKDSGGSEDKKFAKTFLTLIPGLPTDLAESCLARVPWICHSKLMSVCKAWAAYLMSGNIFAVRSQQSCSESLLLVLSVPLRLGPLRLTVFDAKATTEWHKPLAAFDYLGRWSGFLRGLRCAVVGPNLFIIGGRPDGLHSATSRCVRRFDFITRKWIEAAPMHAPRRDFACAVVEDKIYVAGGTDSKLVLPQGQGARSALKSAEVYDCAQDRWHNLPNLEIERVGCLGVALDGRFYVIGGGTDNGTVEFELSQSAEVLDTREPPQWKTIDEMWQSHVKLPRAVAGFDHSLFAVDSNDQTLKSYDESKNEWTYVMPMPSSSTILPARTGLAERQQALGGLPGDQLIDFPREGLFWMGPRSRLSHVHEYHLLRLHERTNTKDSWCGNVAITVDHDDELRSTSATETAATRHSEGKFESLGKNSYLIIGSGIVYI